MKRSLIFSGLLAIGLLATGSAFAGTTTSSFTAGVVVDSACEVSGTALSFGSLGILADAANAIPGADNIQAQSALTVNCTNAMPITISVGSPSGSAGKYAMTGATTNDQLAYRIFQDSAYQTPWGTDTGTNTLAMTAVVGSQTVPLYGEILASDNAGVGAGNVHVVYADSYADTATVNVNW